MRSRDIVGKRIAKVNQRGWRDPEYGWITSIDSVELEDGSWIVFGTHPTIDMPVVTARVYKHELKEDQIMDLSSVDLSSIDTELLLEQLSTLRAVIDGLNVRDAESEETADHLSGIQNLLEYIYDQLVPVEEKS